MTKLEETINKFEKAMTDLEILIREGHTLLKDLRNERKNIEKLISTDVKQMVHDQADEIVKTELDKIGPTIREQTSLIYDKVGNQIDKLIDLSLGRPFAFSRGREDIRPELAAKLGEWIREIISKP